jgi:Radical SAM superfamily/Iron-sulfur cluster-binding domain
MESLYYVLCYACHRRCVHCYEDKFRPYRRQELAEVVAMARGNVPRIIANLPEAMRYIDLEGGHEERTGRIILAGGEVLMDPVREEVLYPAIEALSAKYKHAGGVKLVVQTTGDLVTEAIIEELLARGVWMISVAGMDDFHVGLEGARRGPLIDGLTHWFEAAGMSASGSRTGTGNWRHEEGPVYSFFGATPQSWIGKLWPRGRAWKNGLSTATIADNFCARWSGGLNFLNHRLSGSEVAIEPTGDVYPCCLKTKHPLGNLTEERLIDIIESVAAHPAFQAINLGRPDQMGLTLGWSVDRFVRRSETRTPKGDVYRNLCIGCDAFHREVLGPVIEGLRAARLRRHGAAAQ